MGRDSVAHHLTVAGQIKVGTNQTDFRRSLEMEQLLLSGEADGNVSEYIEELLNRQAPLLKVLRLLCLESQTHGLKPKRFEFFRRELVHAYGIKMMLVLDNLERAGLLRRNDSKPVFEKIRKPLRLWTDEVDEINPTDVAYVHSGYAPISVRIVEAALKNGWKAAEKLAEPLPGPFFCDRQVGAGDVIGSTRIIALLAIGGLTFAEIAALRFLQEKDLSAPGQSEGKARFLIITTDIVNGRTLLQGLTNVLGETAGSTSS
eukprot:NODE_930_length_1082_cov_161.960310_g763_i0.p1 GENE.NODE_930_length_1082_cov_161.960310_g763_i0~~NODE_930_length_1082_cov_161.960310_g763_i0.p1  ORF type:complete len:260 (+),score=74.04 NODE_930_length_1082_cov_161.960310_g763_i0:31-810(+)